MRGGLTWLLVQTLEPDRHLVSTLMALARLR
jgi:hypothetical protein